MAGLDVALERRSRVWVPGLGSFSLDATFLQAVKFFLVNWYKCLIEMVTSGT